MVPSCDVTSITQELQDTAAGGKELKDPCV